MSNSSSASASEGRLATLLKLLESDPTNQSLASDTAKAALELRRPDVARDVLDTFSAREKLSPEQSNIAGLAALQLGEFDRATTIFRELLENNQADSALRFNLAWSLAKLGDFDAAIALLREGDIDSLPQAAMLRVQLLHKKGALDQALTEAKRLVSLHPHYGPLLAAASVVAVDAEDLPFADECANAAPENPDSLTTLGTIALSEDRGADAAALFSQALEKDPTSPRALIGIGLGKLLTGAHADGARELEQGAAIFGDHIGSWIAAGWAHIFTGNLAAARQCFEKALAIDHSFGETHGSLAVLDLMEGRVEEARREAQTALRLDRQSFAGTFANALLLSARGNKDGARALIERALHSPVDASGRTIAQSLARYGLSL